MEEKNQLLDFDLLSQRLPKIKEQFQNAKPFRYVIIDNFYPIESAELILSEYPSIKNGVWDGKTYVDQKNKFQKTDFEDSPKIKQAFDELNSPRFLELLESVTGFNEKLIADPDLFGGGLHQSIKGAFLNVHVDYNIHPETKYHRRLNTLVYMNKDWKDEYEGHLELWDLRSGKKDLLEKISPVFNRCVIFETNEISFHGHPKPLNTPSDMNRKSMALYYYTQTRPEDEIASEHNTIYVNTEGTSGAVKRFMNGIKTAIERISK
ncbi:2OG-Fe(II) oxygenase [Ekhidna sp. To15]|uniref:2OG-Fe(II) oxygenase n=1 Tax=Ekhidna sp. To15 TaxID=3395267 RepID=UPI003F521F23